MDGRNGSYETSMNMHSQELIGSAVKLDDDFKEFKDLRELAANRTNLKDEKQANPCCRKGPYDIMIK